MCKFIKLKIDDNQKLDTLHYIPSIENCYKKYFKYFQDDFAEVNFIKFLYKSSSYFWIILNMQNCFMGFVFLDNFIGTKNYLYSAELTTCFDKKAWGGFTRYSAKIFLKKCFDELGLYKIKAQIYPDNFRVKNLLKDTGFVYESTLKNETIRQGKTQDIEVYVLYRSYYYKRNQGDKYEY